MGEFFRDAHHFNIGGGNFTSVQGGQHHYGPSTHNETIYGNKIGHISGGAVNGVVNNGSSPQHLTPGTPSQGNNIGQVSGGTVNGIVNNGLSPERLTPTSYPPSGHSASPMQTQGETQANQGGYQHASYQSQSPSPQHQGYQALMHAATDPLPLNQSHRPQLPQAQSGPTNSKFGNAGHQSQGNIDELANSNRGHQPQTPPKSDFKCTCTDPDCNVVDFLAPQTEKWMKGWKLDACIVGLSILKEAASGTGGVDGLRQAAGCGLTILKMLADMRDNRAFLHDLAQRAFETLLLVQDLRVRLQKDGKQPTRAFEVQIQKFGLVMEGIKASVKRIVRRHAFVRWLMSGPDKVKIRRHRERLTDTISQFQLFMQMDLYTGMNRTDKSDTKPLEDWDPEKLLKDLTKEIIRAAAAEQIAESRKDATSNKDAANPTTNINAPLISVNNPTKSNVTMYKSGNVTTTTHQNNNNDYSTKNITINGALNGPLTFGDT